MAGQTICMLITMETGWYIAWSNCFHIVWVSWLWEMQIREHGGGWVKTAYFFIFATKPNSVLPPPIFLHSIILRLSPQWLPPPSLFRLHWLPGVIGNNTNLLPVSLFVTMIISWLLHAIMESIVWVLPSLTDYSHPPKIIPFLPWIGLHQESLQCIYLFQHFHQYRQAHGVSKWNS